MARHRAKKTPSAPQLASAQKASGKAGDSQIPKSMVIRMGAGEIGPSMSQLVKDFREMMGPHTASRLKVRGEPRRHNSRSDSGLTRSAGQTDYATTLLWQGR